MEFYKADYVPSQITPEWTTFIPAIWDTEFKYAGEDGTLVFAQNGISTKYFNDENLGKYRREDFIYFCTSQFLLSDKTTLPRPFFMYDGADRTVPGVWELRYVFSKRDRAEHNMLKKTILFSMLIPSMNGTLLCKCDDCKQSYVIEAKEAKQMEEKGWRPPIVRCPTCRMTRKIRQ